MPSYAIDSWTSGSSYTRSVIYLATLLFTGGTFAILLAISNIFLPDEHDFSAREIALVFALVVCLHPLKTFVQRLDRYLYRDPYDYARTLREASQALTATIDLQVLLRYAGSVLESTLHPEGLAVYLYDPEDKESRLYWRSGSGDFPHVLSTTSAAWAALSNGHIVFRDEAAIREPDDTPNALHSELDRIDTEVLVPLIEEGQLIGFLVLGAKRSGDPYFSNDADLLTTLANQSAVAVRNAQTHRAWCRSTRRCGRSSTTIESGVVAVGPPRAHHPLQ